MIRDIVFRMVVAAAVVVGVEPSGFWVWLGAHPFWSLKVAYFGVGAGIVLWLVSDWLARRNGSERATPIAILIVAIIVTGATSWYGKTEFAASFAENAFAGLLWYYGFIAFVACIFATLVAISKVIVPTIRLSMGED